MMLENTRQEIRNHSFIQNLSRPFRFTASSWCFFSSVHPTHFLQGSGQRTGKTIAEVWFCAQWRIVFEVYVWIIVRLEDPNMAHYKISNRVSHWCHVSKQVVQDLQQKYRPTTLKVQQYISLYTRGTFCPCVYKTYLECLLLKSNFFILSDRRSQSHLKFQSCLITVWSLILDELG